MSLTDEQVGEAIDQMVSHCDLKMEDYSSVSARQVLYELGYHADAEQVLRFVHEGGFTYCLDPMFPSRSSEGLEPTPEFACYWGPDQLASRLQSLSNYRPRTRCRRWSEIEGR